MVFPTLPADHHVWIEAGRRHHAENFARFRFNGYNSAYFVLHQTFAQHLKIDVDTQFQILARYRRTVQLSVHIMSLYAAMRIA